MKKRIAAWIVLLSAAALLANCTAAAPNCASPQVVCVGLVTDVDKLDDRASNQSAWDGIRQAQEEGLVHASNVIESGDARDYDENIAVFAEAGYDIIVTVGAGAGNATRAAAEAYPAVYFIGVDQFQEAGAEQPNLSGLVFHEDRAGFMAGALAAQMTATGKVGAVLGAADDPPVQNYGEGFRSGVEYIDPAVEATVAYHNDAGFDEAAFDPDWGATTAYLLVDAGADVIFGGRGTTGDAALVAAAQRGVYVIGAQADQYYRLPEAAPRLLSSMVEQVAAGVFELVGLAVAASSGAGGFMGGNFFGECSYAPFHDLAGNVPEEVEARMAEIAQGLSRGTIQARPQP
jgi:basic membrane protein A